jgi:transcriptional regulator with XRE-family HTH domain
MDKLDTPGKRIRWALKQRKTSAAELGRRLGITRSAVSQWWSEHGATSPLEKLPQIAEELQVYENWLLTGEGEALRERARFPQGSHANRPDIAQALVVGIVEGEVWREGTLIKQQILRQAEISEGRGNLTIPSVPRPDVLGLKQFAFEIRGASCDKIARNGEYAICVDFDSVRPDGLANGDVVALEKRRSEREYKLLICRAQFSGGHWLLSYESDDPRWQNEKPMRLQKQGNRWRDASDHHEIIMLGFVLGVFRTSLLPTTPLVSTIMARLADALRWTWRDFVLAGREIVCALGKPAGPRTVPALRAAKQQLTNPGDCLAMA